MSHNLSGTQRLVAVVASAAMIVTMAACGRGGSSDSGESAGSGSAPGSSSAPSAASGSSGSAASAPSASSPSSPDTSSGQSAEPPAGDVPGVTADTITIGGSFPFSGGLAIYGDLSKGLAAYFKKVNAEGGVNGRTIKYIALDDGYDPSRVQSNARKLVEQEKVFAFAGFGGTNLTIRDYMKSKSVPQFVMAGNAPLSDVQTYPDTHAWWPDIRLEGAITAKTVLAENPDAKIGTLGLNNDITASQVEGVKDGLGDNTDQLVQQEVFPPTAQDLTGQMNRLKAAGVDTIISGINAPSGSNALQYIAQLGWSPEIYNYSVASSVQALTGPAGASAKGVHSVQWLKDPADPQWKDDPGMQAFKKAIADYGDGADADSMLVLNGYAFGQALVSVLKTMDNPTRQGLLDAWGKVDGVANDALLPGLKLGAGPDGRLIHRYRLTTWDGTTWKVSGDVIDAYKLGLLQK